MTAIQHPGESASNNARDAAARYEPRCLRTYTPTQAVLARSAGIYHWMPEGRRLYDFPPGVLVPNLGHNPQSWLNGFVDHMTWSAEGWGKSGTYLDALPMTAYNAITEVEIEASRRLVELVQG